MFETEYEKTEIKKSEVVFNASTSLNVTIEGGGSYSGVTASMKSTTDVSFGVQKSTFVQEQWVTKGKSGQVPIYKLFVFPLLRVRLIKRQHISFTINNSSEELKWSGDSYRDGYWGERWVGAGRLSRVTGLQYNPVPMSGWACPEKAYILPVPKVDDKGEFSATTVMSRQGWKDWYVYDGAKWEGIPAGESTVMDLSARYNDCAFQPMYTVVPL
jgi:hypothetical protein